MDAAKLDKCVKDTLELQLSELEMLSSMYCNPGEFELDDPFAVSQVQEYVEGNLDYACLQNRLGFIMKIHIDNDKEPLEVVCHLPHEYPDLAPELFLRCSMLSRSDHKRLSEDLQNYIESLDRGDICLAPAIQWLQDNVSDYISAANVDNKKPATQIQQDLKFCRMWIYSHHIYSKIKRKAILEYTNELHLTGFCMPGKPGIIAIEGYDYNVEDFWQRIRRMQWKKITMTDKEDFNLGNKDIKEFQKFDGFEEKYFEPRQGKGRGAHMDRGLLYQFLQERGCGHIFQVYFGVEGKIAEYQDSE